MPAMEDMIKGMLPKLLGPEMPKILAGLQDAFGQIEAFQAQLNRIEGTNAEIDRKLTLLLAGGPSIAERIEQGLGIIQDVPMHEMIGAAEHANGSGDFERTHEYDIGRPPGC